MITTYNNDSGYKSQERVPILHTEQNYTFCQMTFFGRNTCILLTFCTDKVNPYRKIGREGSIL